MPNPEVDITFCCLCDDVRMEVSGKYILIGVYTSDIGMVRGLPSLNLVATLWANAVSAGNHKLDVRMQLDGDNVSEFSGEYTADAPGSSLVAIPFQVIGVRRNAVLTVSVRRSDDNWSEVLSIPVRVVDAPHTVSV